MPWWLLFIWFNNQFMNQNIGISYVPLFASPSSYINSLLGGFLVIESSAQHFNNNVHVLDTWNKENIFLIDWILIFAWDNGKSKIFLPQTIQVRFIYNT